MPEITIIPGTLRLEKMSDADYFATPGISNSKLSLINPDEDGSPEKYELGFTSGYSESFAFGSAIHAKVLQPDYFTIADIDKPSGKLGLFAEEMFKLRSRGVPIHKAIPIASNEADYYAGKLKDNRLKTALRSCLPFYLQRIHYKEKEGKETIFISSAMRLKFDQCMANIEKKSSRILSTLYPEGIVTPAEFYNEYAIFCEVDYVDTETGEITRLKLKGKLDNFTIDHETETITLNDLKTTGKPVSYFMGNHVDRVNSEGDLETIWYNGSFQSYHYYRQVAMYFWMLQAAVKEIYGLSYKPKCNMLVVESTPEFQCKVYPVNGKHIKAGLDEFKNLLTLVVEWMNSKSLN